MQPSRRKRRQIGTALRPERPLRYEGLSDPILVRRARDGDTQALGALCGRHAARVDRLAALPETHARVLVLKDALGFSFEAVSAAAGIPVGTAKCYAHRGRAAMPEVLEAGAAT